MNSPVTINNDKYHAMELDIKVVKPIYNKVPNTDAMYAAKVQALCIIACIVIPLLTMLIVAALTE